MIEINELPELHRPVLLLAFEGWNDAAAAATGVIDHLVDVWDAEVVAAVDPEEFYDFQVNRPSIGADDQGMRRLTWPSTELYLARPQGLNRDVLLLRGIEPNMRWRQFTAEILAAADDLEVEMVISLGAMLAETPHTRPIQVSGYSSEPELEDRLDLQPATYEGPTGIVGVITDACQRLDLPVVSFWAAVPHYLPAPPCPKATLALLGQVEDVLDCSVPLGELPEDAQAWDRGVAELADEDEDIADYVRQLEESSDTADLPEASGDAIAREFERYLKRRTDES